FVNVRGDSGSPLAFQHLMPSMLSMLLGPRLDRDRDNAALQSVHGVRAASAAGRGCQMPQQVFRVANTAGMWLRTEPVVSEATKKVLLPNGQQVTKLADTDKTDWWRVQTTVSGQVLEGFSNRTLLVADTGTQPAPALITTTLAALQQVAPRARDPYLQ